MTSRIAVCAAGPGPGLAPGPGPGDEADSMQRAAALAAELGLPLVDLEAATDEADLLLEVTPERLQMRQPGARTGPVWCEFLEGPMGFRRRVGAEHSGLLARAVGWKHQPLKVVDATAGLGRDAFMLALLGCEVTAVERSPVLFALLRDGIERAKRDEELRPILEQRLRLVHADARDFLTSLVPEQRPDVVYLDPMFPERRKSAMVKKEMVLCRLAAGEDEDAAALLAGAQAPGVHRITVKRPLHAPSISDAKPTLMMKGKAVRYDIYIEP